MMMPIPRTLLLASATVMTLAQPARAQDDRLPPDVVAGTEVRVTRSEATISFPRDTESAWGWSADSRPSGEYVWQIGMGEEDLPRVVLFRVVPQRARRFPSLAALVAAGEAHVCWPMLMIRCDETPVEAAVRGGRVVLTLRDTAAIHRLFGTRPAVALAAVGRPGNPRRGVEATVPVTYADPQLPPPDSAFLAWNAAARRQFVAVPRRVLRSIEPQDRGRTNFWTTTGDSLLLDVSESRCRGDACSTTLAPFADAAWSVADGTVARIRPVPVTAEQRRSSARAALFWVVGLRPGRTLLRISNLHSALDTATSEPAVSSTVEQEIVVTGPIAAVRICPRLTRVAADTTLVLHVEAVDRAGNVFRDPPAYLQLDGGVAGYRAGERGIPISTRGPHSISVEFAGRADTLHLQAVGKTRAPADPPLPRSEGECSADALLPARSVDRRP
jgi:hypothetical protein